MRFQRKNLFATHLHLAMQRQTFFSSHAARISFSLFQISALPVQRGLVYATIIKHCLTAITVTAKIVAGLNLRGTYN